MALTVNFAGYVETSEGTKHQKWHATFHVPFERTAIGQVRTELVTEVQADGDELTHVEWKFNNLPMPKVITGHTVVRWFGDDAKFIVANL
jgi:hypothetical protein